MSPVQAVRSQPWPMVADRYRVGVELGRGGTAVVYEAVEVQTGKLFAIKVLDRPPTGRGPEKHPLLLDAQLAMGLTSPHAVRVFEVGALGDGRPFLVMERLSGQDVARRLAEKGAMSVMAASDIALQACHALADAHRLGVVHRDIKPGNLFLPKRADGNVKVLDFGLAAMVTSELTGADNTQVTRTLSVNGSAGYAAPEQIGSQRMIDSRADIWGLGVVLYELVSGRRPFESASLIESLIAAGSQPAPPMGQVPPAFESLVRRCLEKDRELRFPNVAALAEALAPFAPPERANYPEYVRQVGGKEVEAEATQRIVLDEQGPPSGVPSRANPKPNTAVAEPGATRGETSSLFVAQVVPARAPPWAGLFAIVAVSLVAMSVVISHARGEPSLARQAPAPSTPLASSSMRLPPLPRASASSSGVPRAGRQAGEPEAPSDGQEVP